MQLAFYFDQTRCTGCCTCSIACKDWHDIPAGRVQILKVSCLEEGTFPNISVSYLVSPCFHCAQPLCVEACPAEAIIKRKEDGIVVVDRDLCLGEASCGLCREACPYGAPQYGEEDPKMLKCDLCLDRWQEGKKPVCVEACPTRALDAGPLGEIEAKYGSSPVAAGFSYASEAQPSVIFKAKDKTKMYG